MRQSFSLFSATTVLIALLFGLLAAYPVGRLLLRLLVQDGKFELAPLHAVLDEPGLGKVLTNTLTVVVVSGVIAVVIGAILAWLSVRTDAGLGVLTDSIPLLPFLLPPIAGSIGWVLLLSPRSGYLNVLLRWLVGSDASSGPFDIFTWSGLIFIYVIYMIPFAFLMIAAGLRSLDPQIEEQSRVCGAGLFQTIRRATIPALGPSLGGAGMLMVWFGFAFFSGPVIIGTGARIDVLSTRIVRALTFTYPAQTDLAIGLSTIMLSAIAAAWIIQRRILRRGRHAVIGGRGHRGTLVRLGVWRWPGRLAILLYVAMASVMPMIALVLVALNGFWTPDIDWGGLNFDQFRQVLERDPIFRHAVATSLKLSVVGATISIVAAALIALFVKRSSSRFAQIIDGTIKMPAALSGIVIGVAFIIAFGGTPFNLNGTFVILLAAYVVSHMPQASIASDASVAQVGRELPEASSIAGASGSRTFRKVYLPLMLPGLAAGWALLFVWMFTELNASVMLAGPRTPVVGLQILRVYETGVWGELAAMALVLNIVATSMIVVVAFLSRRYRASWTGVA